VDWIWQKIIELIGGDIATIILIVTCWKIFITGCKKILEKVKDITATDLDNKIYYWVNKLADWTDTILDWLIGNTKHK